MWKRRTFHECAVELEGISNGFRSAYSGTDANRAQDLERYSVQGVEILRILASAIRSEQDYGILGRVSTYVGSVRKKTDEAEINDMLQNYKPPYMLLENYEPLSLREGLNKIMHTNGMRSGFYADRSNHDLILSGTDRGASWVAVVSLVDLCRVIKSLPDAAITPMN